MAYLLALLLLQDAAQPQEEKKQDWNFSVDMTGVHARTADGAFDVNLGGRYITIGRFVESHDTTLSGNAAADFFRDNGFYTRQARIELWGTFSKVWGFKVSADLVTSTPTLADGYVEYTGTRWLMVRVGQFKTPQGMEQTASTLYTTMIERYPGDAILPGRDVGIMAYGFLFGESFKYELMIGNGNFVTDQNKSVGSAGPVDDDLDFLMQFTIYPGKWLDWDITKKLIAGYFHTTGEADELPVADLRTRDTGTKILDFDDNVTTAGAPSPAGRVVQDKQRERDGVFFAWPYKNFGVAGEWGRVDMTLLDLGGGRGRKTSWMWAWFIDAVWIVTGEEKEFYKRIVPKDPLHQGGAGAWELAVRFGQWQVDDSIAPYLEGFSFPERVTNHTFGINWWPHSNVRASLNVVYNTFKGRVLLPADDLRNETALMFRFQFGF